MFNILNIDVRDLLMTEEMWISLRYVIVRNVELWQRRKRKPTNLNWTTCDMTNIDSNIDSHTKNNEDKLTTIGTQSVGTSSIK